jgi:phage baseplate assembly protein W
MKHTVVACSDLLVAAQWRLIDAELDAGVELDATVQRPLTVHEPRLCAARVRVGGTRCDGP